MEPRVDIPDPALAMLCGRWHITRLSFFGSVLRDDFGPESDVDVLAEFHPDHTPDLLDLARISRELSALLDGREVDLVTPGGLHPRLRGRILAEAVERFAA